jgi:hypothetical protein
VDGSAPLWEALGELETRLLERRLRGVAVTKPVYIAGLARSGTTLLLECLAAHPEVATHRYRDFPFLFTPYAWHRFLEVAGRRRHAPAERTHGDGIMVTPESPEAFEEVLWMHFFPDVRDGSASTLPGTAAQRARFQRFYAEHVRKLLLARGRRRYVAKGNGNVPRLAYLGEVFPAARFLLPVREPAAHIASLMEQHQRFARAQTASRGVRAHLRRAGHFEFGLDRRVPHLGDAGRREAILSAWRAGEEARGWALLWDYQHRFVCDLLESNSSLGARARVVLHESLRRHPREMLGELFAFCELASDAVPVPAMADRIGRWTPRLPPLEAGEAEIVARITAKTHARCRNLARRHCALA